MMEPKIIKNESDYEAALGYIDQLILKDDLNSKEVETIELWSTLIELYEQKVYPIELPTAVEAIRFRMEQEGLKQSDLVAYMGSKSKVSEVLAEKRSLSLNMIRRLHEGLGISAEVLLQEKGAELPPQTDINWLKFPIAEMLKRNWFEGFSGTLQQAKEQAEELVRGIAAVAGIDIMQPVFCRQLLRNNSKTDDYAITAWKMRICCLAKKNIVGNFESGTINEDFAKELIKLSYFENGPLLAREFLGKNGIHLLIEEHLPKTYLDGAAFMLASGNPVIALTLRYDRLDNFWFTLAHELAHIALHLDINENNTFFDNLEIEAISEPEIEADKWAQEVLIPAKEWNIANLSHNSTAFQIVAFSQQLRINPALPAGRVRKESNNFRIHSRLVGNKHVKKLFIDKGNHQIP